MRGQRLEDAALVVIVLLVGVGAGWVSFTHVHDFTMTNSPQGTPDIFGWVNSTISELVPIAALLMVRRRSRSKRPIRTLLAFLVCATLFSLTAQLAVAEPTPAGWLVSAVPAIAFLSLGKLALSELATAPVREELSAPNGKAELPVSGEPAELPPPAPEAPTEEVLAPADRELPLPELHSDWDPASEAEVAPRMRRNLKPPTKEADGPHRKRKRKPKDERRAEAEALLADGLSRKDVAHRMGISTRQLRNIMNS